MAAQSRSTFDAALKDYYEGLIRRIIQRKARLYGFAKKGQKGWVGRQVVFPVNVLGSGASAFMNAGGNLPAAKPQTTVQCQIPLRELWFRIQVLHDTIESARTNRGTFEEPLAFEMDRIQSDVTKRMNIASFGTGHGKLAEVKSYAAGVVTLTNLSDSAGSGINGNAGNRYIHNGDVLDFYTNAATPVSRNQGAVVTAKDVTNEQITVTLGSGTNPAATDGVYWAMPDLASPHNMWPMGAGGVFDDGTFVGTLHNINRTTYGIWKAIVINAGTYAAPGAVSLDLVQRALDLCQEGADVEWPSIMIMHYSTRREIVKLLMTDRRYPEPFQLPAGFKEQSGTDWPWKSTVTIDGIPLVVDPDAPWRTIFGIFPNAFRKWVMTDIHWVPQPGSGQSVYLVPGQAGVLEAQGAVFYNMGPDQAGPASGFAIRHISISNIDRIEEV